MNLQTLPKARGREEPRAPNAGIAPSLERERERLRAYLALMIADIALIFGSCALAYGMYHFIGRPGGQALLGPKLFLPVFLTVALHNGTYSLSALTNWRASSARMARAVLIGAALLSLLAFFVKLNGAFSRVVLVSGLTTATIAMTVVRILLVRFVRAYWGAVPLNRLVIDAGGPPITIPDAYQLDAQELGSGLNRTRR